MATAEMGNEYGEGHTRDDEEIETRSITACCDCITCAGRAVSIIFAVRRSYRDWGSISMQGKG